MQMDNLPNEHRQTYTGFLKAATVGTIFVIMILAGMALFLL